MKALSGEDTTSPAAFAKLQAKLNTAQDRLHYTEKQLSTTEAARVAEAAAAKQANNRASAAEKKARESRSLAAMLKQRECALRESREAESKMSPDYRSLEKEVEASSVEVINLKA